MVRLIRKSTKNCGTEVDQSSDKLKELKAQKKQVDDEFGQPISPEGFDSLQREIVETEQKLKSLKGLQEVQVRILQKYLRYPESLEIRSKESDNPCCQ